MADKIYKIEAGAGLTAIDRAYALNTEWSKFERPKRIYGIKAGGTVGFPIEVQPNGDVHLTQSNDKNRKFWNIHSALIESDLDVLKNLLDQDMNNGQWNGYKNAILNGASGKVNSNQVIPNTWRSI